MYFTFACLFSLEWAQGNVKGLGDLVALKVLYLSSTQVGGDVKGLGGLVALTVLDLDDTEVQGGGLDELREHQKTLSGP